MQTEQSQLKKPTPIVGNRQILLVNWKIYADIAYIPSDIVRFVVEIGCGLPDELGNAEHLRRTEAAGGDSGRADAHARGDERTFRVVRDGILVGGDVHLVQTALQLLAGHAGLSQVDEHQVVVRAARHKVEALLPECVREHAGIGDNILLICLELRPECLTEADRLCGDDMLERAALCAGEDGLVKFLRQLLIVRQDNAAARTAQRLVRRGGDDICVGNLRRSR